MAAPGNIVTILLMIPLEATKPPKPGNQGELLSSSLLLLPRGLCRVRGVDSPPCSRGGHFAVWHQGTKKAEHTNR